MARDKDRQQGIPAAAASSADDDDDDDSGLDRSRAGRDRKTTGTSSEKRKGLEKLKQSRLQKGNKDKKVQPYFKDRGYGRWSRMGWD